MRNTYSNMRGGSSGTMIMIVVVMLVCMSSIMMCTMGPLGGLLGGLGSLTKGTGDLVGGAASGVGKGLSAAGSVVSGEAFKPNLTNLGNISENTKPATAECNEECQRNRAIFGLLAKANQK